VWVYKTDAWHRPVTGANTTLHEARKAYTRAVNVEQRSSLEMQRLEVLHQEELGCLERLLNEEGEQRVEVVVSP
jgi:hypothetical protein